MTACRKTREDTMDRMTHIDLLDAPHRGRRRFLKQVATGAVAGVAVVPAWAEETWAQETGGTAAPADQPPVAETLARYATTLKYEDLPPEVVREAKRFIIDTIGCGLGGFGAEPRPIANKPAARVTAPAGAAGLCSGVHTGPKPGGVATGPAPRKPPSTQRSIA